jgi:hypothetical protein
MNPPGYYSKLLLSCYISAPAVYCLQVDGNGKVLDFLTDPTGRHVSAVSAVTEHVIHDHDDDSGSSSRRRLFLGNLVGNYVSYVDLDSTDAAGDDAAQRSSGSDSGLQGQEEL